MCDHAGHCEHAHAEEDVSASYNLFKFIDKENLVCLNESVQDSGKKVFKPFEVNLFIEGFNNALGEKGCEHTC